MSRDDAAEPAGASCHVSVMPDEIVEWISGASPRVVIDGTYGGGGHSKLLLDHVPDDGLIIGLDRDPAVLQRVEGEPPNERLSVFLGSYEQAAKAMAACDVEAVDGFVLDLGLSSDQLADRQRGFSFQNDGPLDLRFDPENGIGASEWLARKSEKEIADAIYQYGEERYSRRIAREVVALARARTPIRTVAEMVSVCRRCVRRGKNHDIHPATRTFQALRIVVNEELDILQRTLKVAPSWMRPGGRIAIISFHSLEDRIVKNAFREDDRLEVLTKKPLRPSEQETARNPRARSAKLRVAQRKTDC